MTDPEIEYRRLVGGDPVGDVVTKVVRATSRAARTGGTAVSATTDLLRSSAQDYRRVDEGVGGGMRRMGPG
ncbi:hypothetical protein [Nocardioides solisilvae]|uniref:hypothetical protein n=1 Tax=Nocardioides solisilvae TaxID=1542435 RepID=UPI000D74E151|nr:hypothetical protein [Nocardioides solisilvae]